MSETNGKIHMLNVLWFRADGGAEKYAEYAAAASPIVAKYGGEMLDSFVPELALIGEWDPDLFFIVEWPEWEAFLRLPQDPAYKEISHLRDEALTNSLLIRCKRN
jgi:uncharacterized protein (DUF1330 family)